MSLLSEKDPYIAAALLSHTKCPRLKISTKMTSLLASICLYQAVANYQKKASHSFMVVRRTNTEQTAKPLKSDSVAPCLRAYVSVPCPPFFRTRVFGVCHGTLVFLPQFSSSSPLSQSFSPSHRQDTGIHWVDRAPQLISFMRHVLISVDDIQSQKSLQTGQCKAAAPVLPGIATPGTQWSGTRGTLTSGSRADPSPAPSLEAVPSKATWQHPGEPWPCHSFKVLRHAQFWLLFSLAQLSWFVGLLLVHYLCLDISGHTRYCHLILTLLKVKWANTYESVHGIVAFLGL